MLVARSGMPAPLIRAGIPVPTIGPGTLTPLSTKAASAAMSSLGDLWLPLGRRLQNSPLDRQKLACERSSVELAPLRSTAMACPTGVAEYRFVDLNTVFVELD